MEFENILTIFTQSVEKNDGRQLASLFREDGVYDDYIYGPFKGRKNIELMITEHFHNDAKDFSWKMYDPIFKGNKGYARYRFSFSSTMEISEGLRVAVPGMAFFHFKDGLIDYYTESVNGGIPMAQLGLPADKIKRIFEKWSERTLNYDKELQSMFLGSKK